MRPELNPSPASRARAHFASIPVPSSTINLTIRPSPPPISSATQSCPPVRLYFSSWWNAYDLVRPWNDLLARLSDRRSSTGCPLLKASALVEARNPDSSFLETSLCRLSDTLQKSVVHGKSMSDRTLSASFPAGPPSPSSPAAGSLKESRQLPVSSDHFPQTPASPPLMSVSDQNHVSNTTSSHTSPDQATIRPPSTSSPPSSTPMSAQFSQQPAMSTTNSFPTPASSVGGHPANVTSIEDAAHKSFASGMQDSTGTMEGPFGQQAAGHRRTDHDRQHSATGAEVGSREFAIEQGHAMDADAMDIDTEPAAFRDLGFDSLQKDFSSAYHLCKRRKNSPIAALAVQ